MYSVALPTLLSHACVTQVVSFVPQVKKCVAAAGKNIEYEGKERVLLESDSPKSPVVVSLARLVDVSRTDWVECR